MWPFLVLGVCVVLVISLITVWRVHAFLALILAALVAGLMAEKLPGAKPRVASVEVVAAEGASLKNHWVRAVELVGEEFGKTAGAIGLVIGFASIISMCLMESGAADKVVRRFLGLFGQKRAAIALLVSTYFLSIPIFFDTMFMLMVPLAMTLCMRTGKDYILYIMVVCCGGVITHSLTVPHPGPLAAVEYLKIDVGFSIVAGIIGGFIPAIGGYWVAKWINRRITIPLRETPGAPLANLRSVMDQPESQLPSFTASILPVILPIFMISLASVFDVANRSDAIGGWGSSFVGAFGNSFSGVFQAVEFFGNKNIALLVGAFISLWLLASHKKMPVSNVTRLIGPPLETAGTIILITSAGGAFGLMLRNAGVGDAIQAVATGTSINIILLSYVVALVMRIAQGSATVAMLTTSAMVGPMLAGMTLPYNPIYLFLSIGFGAFGCSWMNDSGFWVVGKLSGMTERETLSTWTVLLTAVSLIGLVTTLALAAILPLK